MANFKVGDFKTGSNTEPRRRTTQTPPAPESAAAAEPIADAATEEMRPAPVKSLLEQYKDRLTAAGITEDEADAVFDDVLTKGYYQETFTIRGKPLVLRTRSYDDHVRSLAAVEMQSPKFQATQEELQARHNLAASLVEWNGTTYKFGKDSDKEFYATMEAIRRMPVPVYTLLLNALVKFDAKMFVVFSDGAAESF